MRKITKGKVDLFLRKGKTQGRRGEDHLVRRGIEATGEGISRGAEADSDVSAGGADLPEGRGRKVIIVTVRRADLGKSTAPGAGLGLVPLGESVTDPKVPPKNVRKWTIRKRNPNRPRHRIKMGKAGKTRAIAGSLV